MPEDKPGLASLVTGAAADHHGGFFGRDQGGVGGFEFGKRLEPGDAVRGGGILGERSVDRPRNMTGPPRRVSPRKRIRGVAHSVNCAPALGVRQHGPMVHGEGGRLARCRIGYRRDGGKPGIDRPLLG